MHKAGSEETAAKAHLLSMADRELASLVEGYAEKKNTRLYRTCKEIANKCFEAVMALKTKKATGYGRTPQEASSNCLKKLAQAICDEHEGLEFVEESVEKQGWVHAAPSQAPGATASLKTTCFGPHIAQQQKPAKGPQDVCKENAVRLSLHDSKFDLRCSCHSNLAKNPFTSKSNHSKSTSKVSLSKQSDSPLVERKEPPRDYQTSKFSEANEQLLLKEQLAKANAYIQKLQAQLRCFSDENKVLMQLTQYLREAIAQKNGARRNRAITETHKPSGVPPEMELPTTTQLDYQQNESKFKSVANNDMSVDMGRPHNNISFAEESLNGSFLQEKKKIPRLNLKVLPNYHGNSNKSLNRTLLMAYEKLK